MDFKNLLELYFNDRKYWLKSKKKNYFFHIYLKSISLIQRKYRKQITRAQILAQNYYDQTLTLSPRNR